MSSILIRRANMVAAGSGPTPGRLPAGYTELAYLESTGTQYIDTGILGNNYTDFELKFLYKDTVAQILGDRNSSMSQRLTVLNAATSTDYTDDMTWQATYDTNTNPSSVSKQGDVVTISKDAANTYVAFPIAVIPSGKTISVDIMSITGLNSSSATPGETVISIRRDVTASSNGVRLSTFTKDTNTGVYHSEFTSTGNQVYILLRGTYKSTSIVLTGFTVHEKNSAIRLYVNKGNSAEAYVAGLTNNTEYILKTSDRDVYINGTLSATIPTSASFTTPNNLLLFTYLNNGATTTVPAYSGKVYYLKLWQSNSLVRDLVPAMRDSDSEVGFYDLVGDTFLTNAGSGSFGYGTL